MIRRLPLRQKLSLSWQPPFKTFFGGDLIILKHLYLNDYAEFNSKISYIMFLHDYHLASEISTVRTLALKLA